MKQKIQEALFWVVDLPVWVHAAVAISFAAVLYALAFLPSSSIDFSYAGGNCIDKFTLLPTLHATVENDDFEVTHTEYKQLGSIPIFSSKTCVSPKKSPKPGTNKVASAPWGSLFARKSFSVEVPGLPQANLSVLKAPIPVKKSVTIPLNQTDNLHKYEFVVAEKSVGCSPTRSSVNCDVSKLELAQGKEYEYKLLRGFEGEKVRVSEGELATLPAIEVIGASVENGQVIYDKPASFTIETNKELVTAKAFLKLVTNESEEAVKGTLSYEGTKAFITPANDLARNSEYVIEVLEAESSDGSTLVEPYSLQFKLSGGPTISGVSASTVGVATSEVITLTFDQSLKDDLEVNDYIAFSGGNAAIRKKNDTQVAVSLKSLPKCAPFSITIKSGLPSKYEVVSEKDWKFNGRTRCHSLQTIGSTRQGRSIHSYVFGSSGPATMFVGGLHGNESSSRVILNQWIDELEANPSLYNGKRVIVVPGVNIDGLATGSRNNTSNVDLNRNFPTDDWQQDTESKNGIIPGAGGEEPLSEPEAKALADYVQQINPRLLLSYHAVGGVVLGDVGNISESYAAKYASLSGFANTTGKSSQETFSYNVTGSFEEWTVDNIGIPSMIVELKSYTNSGFSSHKSAMRAMLD